MERQFSKPPEARQVEARARARTRGGKVAVASEGRRYVAASQERPGVIYVQERTPAGWACSCQGYEHTGFCKHIGAVERRTEREGWPFGHVAALAKVGRYFPLDIPENVAKRGAVLSVAPVVAEERSSSAPAAPSPELLALRERGRRAKADLYGTAAD